jgi:hypothetical protein
MKILRGTYPPVSDAYSPELRCLVGEMLQVLQLLLLLFIIDSMCEEKPKIKTEYNRDSHEAVHSEEDGRILD